MNGRDNRGRRRPPRKNERNAGDSSRGQNSANGQSSSRGQGSANGQGVSRGQDSKAGSRRAAREAGKGELYSRPRKWSEKPSFAKTGTRAEKSNWVPPKPSSEPVPELHCARCGLRIDDSSEALRDRNSGAPVHFTCVLAELAEQEKLEAGDVVSYIGGGRFGVVHFSEGKADPKKFTIKKIVEWEDKEQRAGWRGVIADHYSVT